MTTATTAREIAALPSRDLFNAAYKTGRALGRPFTADDTTRSPILWQAANVFAQEYEGSFTFMREMHLAALQGLLSANQAKGVLNCLMAEANRRMKTKAQAPATPAAQATPARDLTSIMDGSYTVVFSADRPDDRLTIRIEKWDEFTDRRTGQARTDVRSLKYLAGPNNTEDFIFAAAIDGKGTLFTSRSYGPRVAAALDILAAASTSDLAAMGAAYAFASSRCWRCHRELTTEDSVRGGIGPVCAKRVGAEYGKGALEAAEQAMARLTGQQPTAQAEAVRDDSEAVFDATGQVVNARRYAEIFGEEAA